ncbi:MAG TPA: hypothetical protein DCY79_08360 [Planctomycetaceae bacterium]|nr:hypothetical protein [Planctomycetaceae bacterium]
MVQDGASLKLRVGLPRQLDSRNQLGQPAGYPLILPMFGSPGPPFPSDFKTTAIKCITTISAVHAFRQGNHRTDRWSPLRCPKHRVTHRCLAPVSPNLAGTPVVH